MCGGTEKKGKTWTDGGGRARSKLEAACFTEAGPRGYGGRVDFGAVKKEVAKGQKYFAAYNFFLFHKTFSYLRPDKWGHCEGYRDVFFVGSIFNCFGSL